MLQKFKNKYLRVFIRFVIQKVIGDYDGSNFDGVGQKLDFRELS